MLGALSDNELENNLLTLVSHERELLHELLLHIRELDGRRLYLKRAYPSLFEYLTKVCGYGAASAQRRIEVARLSREAPEILDKIRAGSLLLSQVALAQKYFRKVKPTIERRREILAQMERKSTRESELILVSALGIPKITRTMATPQSDGSVRLEITLSKEQWVLLQRCQELLAHKNPSGDLAQVVTEACSQLLKKQDPLAKPQVTSAAEVIVRKGRYAIKPLVRRKIFQRDQCCQYIDPDSGRQCGSRFQLEIDHIQMISRGGTNSTENLRVLCGNHNKWRSTSVGTR
jgi:hypothetical protein